jgi:cysteinyl-tRNA synthetase
MLRTHYRQPIDWTLHGLDESHKILWDWYNGLENVEADPMPPPSIVEVLCDDLNTPALVAELHKLRRTGTTSSFLSALQFLGFSGSRENIKRNVLGRAPVVKNKILVVITNAVQFVLRFFGVTKSHQNVLRAVNLEVRAQIESNVTVSMNVVRAADIDKLVVARNAARDARNFVEADRIRDQLTAMGIVLKDTKDGTTWERAR